MKKPTLLLFLLMASFSLFPDIDIELFDSDTIIDVQEHFFSLQERVNVQSATRNELMQIPYLSREQIQLIINYRRRNVILNQHYLLSAGIPIETIEEILPLIEFGRAGRLEYTFQNFLRYQERHDNIRNINRLRAYNNVYDLRLYHEHNTSLNNSTMPIGASLNIKTAPDNNLILGQYRIQHGYGLLLHRGAFISQSPGFNSDFRANRSVISPGARPYFSRSFFGVAYEHTISELFTFYIYGSYKDIGASIQDNIVISLSPDNPNPNNIVTHSFYGSILSYQNRGLNLSCSINHSAINMSFMDDETKPISCAVAMSYSFENYMIFGETAHSNDKYANIIGIRNNFQRFLQILSFRHIEHGYNADFASFMSNSASQTNEAGLFYKIEFRNRDFMIQTFADLFENIEPVQRYRERNKGLSWGLRGERYSIFDTDMMLGLSYREKHDKDWRNLSGISRYENRTRDYWKATWQQTNNRFITTRLVYDYQQREYPDYGIQQSGYALSQSIRMQFLTNRVTFTAGVFDTQIPLYLYLYSGRMNNPLLILSGEGQYAIIHANNLLGVFSNNQNLSVEMMCSFLKRDLLEYTLSLLVNWSL